MNLDTERGHILLLELASQVALDEGGLSRIEVLAIISQPLRWLDKEGIADSWHQNLPRQRAKEAAP